MNSFERTIQYMQNELKRYAKSEKAKTSAVQTRERLINQLVEAWNAREQYIQRLEEEATAAAAKHIYLNDIKTMYEAIMLIHGIDDILTWMHMGKNELVYELVYLNRHNMVQVPSKLRKMWNELIKPYTNELTCDEQLEEVKKEIEIMEDIKNTMQKYARNN